MNKIISKTIKIKAPFVMPPTSRYIEDEILKQGLKPLRWAIVDIDKTETDNTIILSVSGEVII